MDEILDLVDIGLGGRMDRDRVDVVRHGGGWRRLRTAACNRHRIGKHGERASET